MKFTDWVRLREQAGAAAPMAGAGNPMLANQSGASADPVVSKMVQDIVSDKAGGPERIKPKAKKVADGLRASAVLAAKSGKFSDAIDKADQASRIQNIADKK